jgi:hypothetical protein
MFIKRKKPLGEHPNSSKVDLAQETKRTRRHSRRRGGTSQSSGTIAEPAEMPKFSSHSHGQRDIHKIKCLPMTDSSQIEDRF